jgi:hypothetical protein
MKAKALFPILKLTHSDCCFHKKAVPQLSTNSNAGAKILSNAEYKQAVPEFRRGIKRALKGIKLASRLNAVLCLHEMQLFVVIEIFISLVTKGIRTCHKPIRIIITHCRGRHDLRMAI